VSEGKGKGREGDSWDGDIVAQTRENENYQSGSEREKSVDDVTCVHWLFV
jgi:hypothetical protein